MIVNTEYTVHLTKEEREQIMSTMMILRQIPGKILFTPLDSRNSRNKITEIQISEACRLLEVLSNNPYWSTENAGL